MQQLVVLLHGKAGSGKDTIAAKLLEHYGKDAAKFALADALKQFAMKMTNTEPDIWFGESSRRNELVTLPWNPKHTFIPRRLLTDIGDALINATGTSLPAYVTAQDIVVSQVPIAIVTDVRYFEELHTLRCILPQSLSVEVYGDFSKLQGVLASHKSEAGIDREFFDLRVNNLPGKLLQTVDRIVKAIEDRRDQCQ